jgi:hypothetical protein
MYAITRTPLGRLCNAVRENPERVEDEGREQHHARLVHPEIGRVGDLEVDRRQRAGDARSTT